MNLQEYDVVRVVELLDPDRSYEGSDGVKRPPALADVATIVHEYDPEDAEAPVVAECSDNDGFTIWLADLEKRELEIVERPRKA